MNDMQVFDFEDNAVRVIDIDGEPWFVAADVCRILDLKNPSKTCADLDDDETGLTSSYSRSSNGTEQKRDMLIINESGLYNLIFRSRKPEAKKFRKWVTAEVLPSIRKTGMYVEPGRIEPPKDEMNGLPDRTFQQWINLIRETRLLYGRAAARDVWAKSPLPAPNEKVFNARPSEFDEESGKEALQLVLRSATNDGVVEDLIAKKDEPAMRKAGVRLFYKDGKEWLSVACVCFRRAVQGTAFENGGLTRALLCLPGAFLLNKTVRFGNNVVRPVVVPLYLYREKAA